LEVKLLELIVELIKEAERKEPVGFTIHLKLL